VDTSLCKSGDALTYSRPKAGSIMNDDSASRSAPINGNNQLVGLASESDCTSHEGLFPKHPVADRSKGRLAFLLVLVCYAIIDYGRLQWVPLGFDTGQEWHVFYASYAELFYHGDVAHWFPYGIYGQPNTLYNLMESSSADYLMMAAGRVFHIRNAVLLFQLSLMLDHLLFLFGIYLLARSLFRRRSATWLCVIGSITFLNGLNLSAIYVLRMVAWYPLILYFLVRFYRDHRAEGLWMAGIIFIFSCLGSAHLQPYVAMGILPFLIMGTWKHPKAWLEVFRCRVGNLASMGVFAIVASLYLYLAVHILDGISIIRPGRVLSGDVGLDDFIGDTNQLFFRMVVSFFVGHCFYIGLLPFGCVLWGLFRTRTPLFALFMGTALFVVWFSIGGLLALAAYFSVPFISFMHHFDLGLFMIPAVLLLAAGAAWDVFNPSRKDLKFWLAVAGYDLLRHRFMPVCRQFPIDDKEPPFVFELLSMGVHQTGGLCRTAGTGSDSQSGAPHSAATFQSAMAGFDFLQQLGSGSVADRFAV